MKEKIKLAIVEDDIAYRKFLINLFSKRKDIEITCETSNGKEFNKSLKLQIPDILLMGLEAPVMDGFETATRLYENHPEIKILILTVYSKDITLLDLIQIGVNGFVFKNEDTRKIIKAVYSLKDYKYYLDEINLKNVSNARKGTSVSVYSNSIEFTGRELEIIKFVCNGLTLKEIADKLFVSTKTVEWHLNKARKKTGIKTRRKFIFFAIENQLNHLKKKETGMIQSVKKISAGDSAFEKELVETIIRQMNKYAIQLKSYLEDSNWVELKRITHTMQSSLIVLDLKEAVQSAELLNKNCGDNIKTTAKEVSNLVFFCNKVITELKNYIAI